KDGVIVASPYAKEQKCVCSYCKYAGICAYEENLKGVKRSSLKLDGATIKTAVENELNKKDNDISEDLSQKNDPVIGGTKEVPIE
ncbi:MAG: hypothetical protein J6R83_03850, partial [Clostridia bacterium]|nr:hypothetical protein [Clostridia bacterium]